MSNNEEKKYLIYLEKMSFDEHHEKTTRFLLLKHILQYEKKIQRHGERCKCGVGNLKIKQ